MVDVPKSFLFQNSQPISLKVFNRQIQNFPKKTVIVPTIAGKTLRIKLLSNEEWVALPLPLDMNDRFVHGGFDYQFSVEIEDLSKAPGVLVSVVKYDDVSVLANPVSYAFCNTLFDVFKEGFGPRCTADSGGVNCYRATTFSNRTHASPAFGQEQAPQQQYYRQKQSFPLIQALVEKRLHYQTSMILLSAMKSNPPLCNLVGKYCKKTIVICGSPPFSFKESKSYEVDVLRNKKPTLGFHNDLHIDDCDKMTKELQLSHVTQGNQDPSLHHILKRFGLGLPTTCGYQFLFNYANSAVRPSSLIPMQYFCADGLGLALQIKNGMMHHFLGWTFSHRTTACIVQDSSTGLIYLNNEQNLFMVYAWGRAGGSKEVKAYSDNNV
jgi:hypothetical protein